MSKALKKTTKKDRTITITDEQYWRIKNALFVIDQCYELTCWTPTDSQGFLQVAVDMANYVRDTLGMREDA